MIQELVGFCDKSFATHTQGLPCYGVPDMSCPDCLKKIHFEKDFERTYDCINMCYWYVCKNIYRYVTEMGWLLHDRKLGLRNRTEPLNICSIGCGPCSELIALEEYRKEYGLSFKYTYTGFDLNTVWEPIQRKVSSLSAPPNSIKFIPSDVFDYYADEDALPNMIILNYMLSDMLKYREDEFSAFIDNLCNFFAGLSSCVLLINDINRGVNKNDPRWYYPIIYKKIVEQCGNNNIESHCFHFEDSMKNFYHYGTKRNQNCIFGKVPQNIITKYSTNTECHSAQMIIIKK